MEQKTKVTVEATIHASIEKVWEAWNAPEQIVQWNTASPDWHSPRAQVDLREGGTFNIRMEPKDDGSKGFDFGGVYNTVSMHKLIEYTMGDGRQVSVHFTSEGGNTHVSETFDAENMHPVDFQKAGWQSIMDSFKRYVENK